MISHKCFLRHHENKTRFDLRIKNTLLTSSDVLTRLDRVKETTAIIKQNCFTTSLRELMFPKNELVGLDAPKFVRYLLYLMSL